MILSGMVAAGTTIWGWILAQVLLLRWVGPRFHFRARLWLYLVSFFIFLIWQWTTFPLNILNGSLLHLLLFCTFMEFYYYIDRPITLRILVEAKKAGHRLDRNQLDQAYDLNYMIQRRLEILAATGYLKPEGGRYYLTFRGRFLASIFARGSALFGVR